MGIPMQPLKKSPVKLVSIQKLFLKSKKISIHHYKALPKITYHFTFNSCSKVATQNSKVEA